jgi:hypothetical protein
VLSSAFIPVSANNYVVRGWLCVSLFSIMAAAAALLAEPCAANASSSAENPLLDAVATLASEIAAIRDLRGPFHLDWQDDSSLPSAQSAALQSQFAARLAAASVFITNEASAALLRVTLRETATQLVIVARISTADGEQVRVTQVSRAAFVAQDAEQPAPNLHKQLIWKQREPILDAVEHATGSGNVLLVLGRETLWVYGSLSEQPALQAVAHIPGVVHASRSLAGRIRFAKEDDAHFVLELPGKACSGLLAEKIVLECATADLRSARSDKGFFSPATDDSAKLLSPCDHHAWVLSADDGDWSKLDHLFLRDTRSPAADRANVFETPGPVLALAGGPEEASSIAVVLNLSTGEYEIHRFTLACRN